MGKKLFLNILHSEPFYFFRYVLEIEDDTYHINENDPNNSWAVSWQHFLNRSREDFQQDWLVQPVFIGGEYKLAWIFAVTYS